MSTGDQQTKTEGQGHQQPTGSIYERFVSKLLGQEMNTIMMVALVGCLVCWGYLEKTEWEPARNREFGEIIKSVAEKNAAAGLKIAEEHTKVELAHITNDKERHADQRAYDTERYNWIREMVLEMREFLLKARVGAVKAPGPEPLVTRPKDDGTTN